MEAFALNLGNRSTLTGLQSPGKQQPGQTKGLPLLVCVHGGSYSSSYFSSIHNTTYELGIPVVAIDRPGTAGSTPLPAPVNEGPDTAIQNQARWLQEEALPSVWRTYGSAFGATSIILLCHSVGATIGIAAAALHAMSSTTTSPAYPLSGLITSAFAHKTKPLPTNIAFTPGPGDVLDEIMLNVSLQHIPADVIARHASMTGLVSVAEMTDMSAPHLWQSYWREKAKEVRIPVLCAVGDADAMIEGTAETMRGFAAAFDNAETEWTILKAAPHAIELSWYGRAWYARCCGFALQSAVKAEMGRTI